MAVALSVAVLASPFFGAILAGTIIGIWLLITDIQMIHTGIQGRGANIDRQFLIRGLQKYGGIKTIIQELTQQIDELNQQISELQTKKGFG